MPPLSIPLDAAYPSTPPARSGTADVSPIVWWIGGAAVAVLVAAMVLLIVVVVRRSAQNRSR